jgi:hypothetical protein
MIRGDIFNVCVFPNFPFAGSVVAVLLSFGNSSATARPNLTTETGQPEFFFSFSLRERVVTGRGRKLGCADSGRVVRA